MDKLSMNAKIALAGLAGVIVSVFLAYVKAEENYGGESRSLYDSYAKSTDEGGYDAPIWIYLLIALAVAAGYLLYSKKAELALVAAGTVFGFIAASYILISKIVSESEGASMGIGAYLGLIAGAAAIYGAFRVSQEK